MLDIGSILYSAHSELTDTKATEPSCEGESKPDFSMELIAFSLIGVLIHLLSRDVGRQLGRIIQDSKSPRDS